MTYMTCSIDAPCSRERGALMVSLSLQVHHFAARRDMNRNLRMRLANLVAHPLAGVRLAMH